MALIASVSAMNRGSTMENSSTGRTGTNSVGLFDTPADQVFQAVAETGLVTDEHLTGPRLCPNVRAVRGRLGYPLPAAVPHEIADHAIKRRAARELPGLVAAEPGAVPS